MTRLSAIAFLALFFCLASRQALACYEESPNFIRLGDAYFEIDDHLQLGSPDKSNALELTGSLEGQWEGDIVETECTGPDRSPVEKIKHAAATAALAATSNILLKISLSKVYKSPSQIKNDRIDLLDVHKIFEFEVTDGEIIATEKFRRKIGQDSRLVELISKISGDKDNLRIEINHYSNGYFVYRQLLTLTRN